jgi:hypothetical protein
VQYAEGSGSSEYRQVFDVVFNSSWRFNVDERPLDRDFLIPPDEALALFPGLVTAWYDCYNTYKRTVDMAFGVTRLGDGTPSETRFLTLCHAAEAMHRDSGLEQYRMNQPDYRRLGKSAVQALGDDTEAIAFLKEQLRHARSVSLRDRLQALRDAGADTEDQLISNTLIGRIVGARNNLVHGSTADGKYVHDPGLLYYLSEYVRWIIKLNLLTNLHLEGFSAAQTIRSNGRFDWLQKGCPDVEDSEDPATPE